MQVLDTAGYLGSDLGSFTFCKLFLHYDVWKEVRTLDVIDDQVDAILVFDYVVDLNDIRVVKFTQ